MKNLKIVVNDNWVLITGKDFAFSYTAAKDVNVNLKPEYGGKHTYFGGLQCNYHEGSQEYVILESILVEISHDILETLEGYEKGDIA